MPMQGDTTVYRFFDTAGVLLYVGISKDLPTRWTHHRLDKPWWTNVATATLQHFPTRGEAEQAEREAIVAERPLYNVKHAATFETPPKVEVPPLYDEMSPSEVAKELMVSAATVKRFEKRGILAPSRRLPGSKYRRYSRADVRQAQERIAAGDFNGTDTVVSP